jgi:Tfp pilus assembly protein PilO
MGVSMGKAKKRTTTTIVVMTLLAIMILLFYFYWSNRTEPLDSSVENQSEVEKLLNKDLVLYYPETPREVVKLFSNMMKVLYDDLNNKMSEDEVKALALKIREIYDTEFLENNPEEIYIQNLYTDIASWKEKDRRITNTRVVNEDLEEENEIDGVKYSVNYVTFTIQENSKVIETWKILLRQDENEKWKILGWQVVPKDGNSVIENAE